MTDAPPIHLTGPQLSMLRQLSLLPGYWHVTSVKQELKALDELVTLRLARVQGHGHDRQFRVTVLGVSEIEARGG